MPLQKRWAEVSRPPGRPGEENAVGIKETLQKEAQALANKAGELVAEEGRELLAQAKEKLDEEVESVKQRAADKVAEVVRNETDGLSEKLTGALKKKK